MAKVQDYGKDTGIEIDLVLYFKAEHKYVDVTYWVAQEKRYATKTIQWALKAILEAHPEFEQVHRSTLVRRTEILVVSRLNSPSIVSALVGRDLEIPYLIPVSRRLVPHIRKIANANSAPA